MLKVSGVTNNMDIWGILDVFEAGNIEVYRWNVNNQSIYDMVDIEGPDILLLDIDNCSAGVYDVLSTGDLKGLVLFSDEIAEELVDIGKPDLLIYKNLEKEGVDSLNTLGISSIENVGGANTIKLIGNYDDDLYIENLYLSFSKPSEEFIKILEEAAEKSDSFRIIGPYKIDLPEYVGVVNNKTLANMICSSKHCLTYNNEFIYDIAANGVLGCSNLDSEVRDAINCADDFLKNTKFNKNIIKKIAFSKSYTKYAINILRSLNFIEEIDIIKELDVEI